MELPVFKYLFGPEDRALLVQIAKDLEIVKAGILSLGGQLVKVKSELTDELTQLGAFQITMSDKMTELNVKLDAANTEIEKTAALVTKVGVDTQTNLKRIADLIANNATPEEIQAAIEKAQAMTEKATGVNAQLQTIDDETEDPANKG